MYYFMMSQCELISLHSNGLLSPAVHSRLLSRCCLAHGGKIALPLSLPSLHERLYTRVESVAQIPQLYLQTVGGSNIKRQILERSPEAIELQAKQLRQVGDVLEATYNENQQRHSRLVESSIHHEFVHKYDENAYMGMLYRLYYPHTGEPLAGNVC